VVPPVVVGVCGASAAGVAASSAACVTTSTMLVDCAGCEEGCFCRDGLVGSSAVCPEGGLNSSAVCLEGGLNSTAVCLEGGLNSSSCFSLEGGLSSSSCFCLEGGLSSCCCASSTLNGDAVREFRPPAVAGIGGAAAPVPDRLAGVAGREAVGVGSDLPAIGQPGDRGNASLVRASWSPLCRDCLGVLLVAAGLLPDDAPPNEAGPLAGNGG